MELPYSKLPRGLAATRQVTWRRPGNIFPLSRVCGTIGGCNPWKLLFLPLCFIQVYGYSWLSWACENPTITTSYIHLARMLVIMGSLRFRSSCVFGLSNKHIVFSEEYLP